MFDMLGLNQGVLQIINKYTQVYPSQFALSWATMQLVNKMYTLIQRSNITEISINLLVVYRESVNLIGYVTRRLSAGSPQ